MNFKVIIMLCIFSSNVFSGNDVATVFIHITDVELQKQLVDKLKKENEWHEEKISGINILKDRKYFVLKYLEKIVLDYIPPDRSVFFDNPMREEFMRRLEEENIPFDVRVYKGDKFVVLPEGYEKQTNLIIDDIENMIIFKDGKWLFGSKVLNDSN